MAQNLVLTDRQHAPAGVTILDEDGQAFATVPEGMTVSFVADNPAVAVVTVAADGLNIDVASGTVGSAVVTASVTFGDGTVKTDTLNVSVVNSAPGSVNFTVGEPVAE